ncbi:MAG: transglutaminase domain-containing protein [Candidatus Methanomethylicia archaeon]
MKQNTILQVVLVIVILVASFNSNIYAQQGIGTYTIKYRIKISNFGEIDYPLTQMRNMTIIATDDYQRLKDLKVFLNGKSVVIRETKVDEYRNIIINVPDIPDKLPPKNEVIIEIEVSVDLYARSIPKISLEDSGSIDEIPSILKEKYCNLTGLWSKSLMAQDIAKKLIGNKTNALEILLTLIKWIESNIQIPLGGGARMPQYPDETIKSKIGDCDDQSNLLVAMCRSLGIPAYIQMAFIYIEGRLYEDTLFNGRYKLTAKNAGGHAWARVYIPPWGWLNVDMTYYIPYEIKGGYMISMNPLDHITNGALYIAKTIITENYVYGDYIMELNKWIKELDEYNLKWEEEYSITPYKMENQNIFADPIVLGSILLLITLITVTILVYVRITKKKRIETINISSKI